MGSATRWILAAGLLWMADSAEAALVTWTLRNVTFNDGGTASGFFALDPTQTDASVNFDIKTTAGTSITSVFPRPFEYTPSNSFTDYVSDPTSSELSFLTTADDPSCSPGPLHFSCGHALFLLFDGPGLPADGGAASLWEDRIF